MKEERTGRVSYHREKLEELSKEELVNLLLKAYGFDDDTLETPRVPIATRPFDLQWEAQNYLRLPAKAEASHDTAPQPLWRIALISFDLTHPIIGVELRGDVSIGRETDGVRPDLDLTPYGAREYGVSRAHAMLCPTNGQLELVDLRSTNGTRWNGDLLSSGVPQVLEDEDVVAFGNLKFQIRLEAQGG